MEIKGLQLADSLRMLRGADSVKSIVAPGEVNSTEKPKGSMSFADFLKQQVSEVNHLTLEADRGIKDAIAGNNDDPQSTMIAMQKADISFRLMLTVKDRLIQAYEQILRTQV